MAPGNAFRNNSDAGKKNADILSLTKAEERLTKGHYETLRVRKKNRRWQDQGRRLLLRGKH